MTNLFVMDLSVVKFLIIYGVANAFFLALSAETMEMIGSLSCQYF